MDVALAADGGGVAETPGDLGDGFDDGFFAGGGGAGGVALLQDHAGEDGAGPGAEVFGGEVLGIDVGGGDGAEVFVDVGGFDVVGIAVVVEELEELVAGKVVAALDDAGDAAVVEVDGVLDSGFAAEVEVDLRAVDIDVAVAQGGEAVGLVLAGVLFVAYADVGGLHDAEDGGEDFFAGHAGEGEVAVDALADGGEDGGEELHAGVLGLVAGLAPAGVVAELLAAAGVAAGGLEVGVGDGGDPDIAPGGRDDEGLNAGEGFGVADGGLAGVEVAEGFAVAEAVNAGGGVSDVAEAGGFGGGGR